MLVTENCPDLIRSWFTTSSPRQTTYERSLRLPTTRAYSGDQDREQIATGRRVGRMATHPGSGDPQHGFARTARFDSEQAAGQ